MKTFKLGMLIVIAIGMVRCSNDVENDIQQESTITQQDVSSEILSKLQQMGFDMDKTSVIPSKGGYIVDGDIFITQETLERGDFQKQAFISIVDCNRAGNIRIQNALGNNAAGRGFQRGIDLWNRVNGTTLRLIPVNNNPDILVRLANPGEIGGWGLGEFPTNGIEGGLIILNLNEPSIDGDPVTAREWGNILTHEIGHNIGFLHAEQGFFGTQVPGTPINDRNSIMTSGSNPSVVFNANNVSRNDRRAVRRMYSNRNNRLCGR
ncbi:hypothetical protein [Aquimarina spongiae]|uniref:Dual-action HEIGH metallo-peptidase n=1 Tax=Aquimarina spongiae TaxID=570521 RepID=A0A1M6F1G3_9FLAO|nr:hypothetical protein [Aquimarina spongiae]SHI91491.1 hypothetical protein SAMN04488508_10442 [Aquimarina spongiae]